MIFLIAKDHQMLVTVFELVTKDVLKSWGFFSTLTPLIANFPVAFK